MIVVWKIW